MGTPQVRPVSQLTLEEDELSAIVNRINALRLQIARAELTTGERLAMIEQLNFWRARLRSALYAALDERAH